MKLAIASGKGGTGKTGKAILVTEPTRSGFHDLKRIPELTSGFKIPSYVVINKYDLNRNMTEPICIWCSEKEIPVIGKIPFDTKIVEVML
jgi:MinD superfamily P-loop ATPase